MWAWRHFAAFFVLLPITVLFAVGLVVALPAGERAVAAIRDFLPSVKTVASILLRLLGYVAGLLCRAHHLIGAPMEFGW